MSTKEGLLSSAQNNSLESKGVQKNFFDISVEEVPLNKGKEEIGEDDSWKWNSWVALPS